MNSLRLLVLDGKTMLLEDIRRMLPGDDILTYEATSAAAAKKIVEENPIDIVVMEVDEFPGQSQQLIRALCQNHPDIDVLVLDRKNGLKDFSSGSGNRGKIVRFSNSFALEEVRKSIEKTTTYITHRERQVQLDKNFELFCQEMGKTEGHKIIGKSRAIKSIASLIMLVSKSDDTSVMVTGESGTGKELVARGIHSMSTRSKHHFHAVNCSAIPESLFESEFFGYRKGAFTGAVEKSTGWFEMADKGTLFLDEITELPMAMQSKFLRVLDDKVIQKIGSHQEIRVNLRIISASNQEADKLQNNSVLRKDLFHRLNTFHIHIPPLRERKEDIPLLLEHFVAEVSRKMNKRIKPVCDNVLEKMMQYAFPGNVRELRNMIESAVILCQEPKIRLNHFCIDARSNPESLSVPPLDKNFNLATIESHIITEVLNRTRFNKTRTAALLKISRQSLDRKIAKFGIII